MSKGGGCFGGLLGSLVLFWFIWFLFLDQQGAIDLLSFLIDGALELAEQLTRIIERRM